MKDLGKNTIIVKILARESITLLVQKDLETASFDLKNRIVRVPDIMHDDDNFVIMVLAHEVGHCLFTPYDGWFAFFDAVKENPKIKDKHKDLGLAKNVLNIVEDFRIDRKMIQRYPGLIRHYRSATIFIVEKDFFRIKKKKKDVTNMSFLDRSLVRDKCDKYDNKPYFYGVTFSDEEQKWLDRMNTTDTWEDVVQLAMDILENFDDLSTELRHLDDAAERDEKDEGQKTGSDSGESDNSEIALPPRMEADEELMDKDKGQKPSDEKPAVDAGGVNQSSQMLYDIWMNSVGERPNIAVSYSYLDKEPTKVINEIKEFSTIPFYKEGKDLKLHEVTKLSKEYEKFVNIFSMKFNMKKRARQLTNNYERPMGTLDPLKLHKYKYDENIFAAKAIENYQKNHAFIFLIDCSSSMAGLFKTIVMQMFAFYKICERIDVPYYFYGYTDHLDMWSDWQDNAPKLHTNFETSLRYYNFIQKGQKKEVIFKNVAAMLTGNIRMGGTPTADALLGIVPEIKRMHHEHFPDILNVVVVTDGSDGTRMESNALTFNGAYYNNRYSPRGSVDNTAAIYSLLREHYGVRIMHMDILGNMARPPTDKLNMDKIAAFEKDGYLSESEFGGADNVLWLRQKLVESKSTAIIDNLVKILA
jgi:hypothetical protein